MVGKEPDVEVGPSSTYALALCKRGLVQGRCSAKLGRKAFKGLPYWGMHRFSLCSYIGCNCSHPCETAKTREITFRALLIGGASEMELAVV
jgi:hypothetical protein